MQLQLATALALGSLSLCANHASVTWDKYSFMTNGSRVFLQSGEVHPWRLPVPSLWMDILQKIKAAGLNTISVYTHWALMNPKQGIVDFTGINDLQKFLDDAREVGLFVILRPGPYINAETTGGGIPGHVLNLPDQNTWFPYNGELRSNDTLFQDAWKDYITGIGKIVAKNQITNGGPVILLQIENEYYNGPGISEYFAQLIKTFRDLGVVIPTTDNDPGLFRNLVDAVDVYGIDAYPVGFDCSTPSVWRATPSPAWRPYHESVNPQEPFFFPEFQGGAFVRWGATTGNEACRELTGVEFQRVYYHQLWASGVTAENFYMVFGGTNWGQLAYPDAATTYDYAAAISETRQLTPKFGELKLQSMFLRNFPELRKTDFISEDNTTHPGVNTTRLRNPDTGTEFFVSRHQVTNDSYTISFDLDIGEDAPVPITIAGRDSVITAVNVTFGARSKLLHSTVALLASLTLDGQDVLVAYGAVGQTYEIALTGNFERQPAVVTQGSSKADTVVVSLIIGPGITTLQLSDPRVLVVIMDYASAVRTWQPTIASPGGSSLANFYDLGATTPVVVSGPYLVRSATVSAHTLLLTGDLDATTNLTVMAPARVTAVTWNGAPVRGLRREAWGALSARLKSPKKIWTLPNLEKLDWRYADSLPEIGELDETTQRLSGMVVANHTSTHNPFPPFYGKPWILYGSEYGFHGGNLVWRGTFEHHQGLPAPTALNLSVSGGQFFAASVWLNDAYLGAMDTGVITANESFPVDGSMLRRGDNHVVIVCCTPGGRQRDIQMPRGIQGYLLVGRDENHQFTQWKVAGNLGGEDFPDKTRKILNEGGLFGERMGWHLPGFDSSHWRRLGPQTGLSRPGVGWFRTTFKLSMPVGVDIPLAIEFSSTKGQYRAQLYVNGWQMGKRIANLGPQTRFPIQPGILDLHGTNTLAVSLWALGEQPADMRVPTLKLVELGAYLGGPGPLTLQNPEWKELRGHLLT
ncbi:hypothetical protein AURDEDRAFT_64886 [Auricularia subglabra TFB-10046 SS5]|nr:hypothetical protein AURDEDRAFT_64886 [Auricularia subglabra TFB-10046 SS5]